MSDMKAVVILSKMRDCILQKKCNMDCQNCPYDYTEKESLEALNTAISACVERSKE